MTKPPNPELVKAIKEAVIELLVEKGVDAVKLRKVAEMVGVTPTTIYYYFDNKNELLRKVSLLVFEDFNEYVDTKLEGDNPPERLKSLRETIFRYAIENPTMFELLFSRKYMPPQGGVKDKQASKIYYHTYNLAIELLKDGVEQGYFDCEDPHLIASASISYIFGVFELYVSKRIPPPYTDKPYKLASYFESLRGDDLIKEK